MIKLGHIIFSNCFPPHAGILTGKTEFPFTLVEGIPSELNRLLREGVIDVSPSSSIEYARNADRYILLPDLSITSKNRVMSIILQSRVPLEELAGKSVALTTASATSVVLLRILLERKQDIRPLYLSFDQRTENPFLRADAALYIGDQALRLAATATHPYLYDLGFLWHEYTGLPFVFALWQVNYRKGIDSDISSLYDILMTSKSYGLAHIREMAIEQAGRFGLPVQLLIDYWSSFSYRFDDGEKQGLLAYYRYAAEIGAVGPITELRIWGKS